MPASFPRISISAILRARGEDGGGCARWEQAIDKAPERAYLTFDRCRSHMRASARQNDSQNYAANDRENQQVGAQGWRWPDISKAGTTPAAPRIALRSARTQSSRLDRASGHLAVLSRLEFERPLCSVRGAHPPRGFYMDPHICMRCRYRSTELLGSARTVTNGIPSSKIVLRRRENLRSSESSVNVSSTTQVDDAWTSRGDCERSRVPEAASSNVPSCVARGRLFACG